ncbi:uncharacterized protein RCC_02263 [Ramularia collo-cygni]|uniref:Uncharacterized protein n=1 Tax=Ramularia collo-cygni TaxID=112498 RepID=A0A2D3UU47_9PEZI|nr:uncharacterized protein RCC_02263 [Ramularia collo-cygni]CZT16420.1 uncharacterized protein RCC_02263 [Ramularia collo-cygni]
MRTWPCQVMDSFRRFWNRILAATLSRLGGVQVKFRSGRVSWLDGNGASTDGGSTVSYRKRAVKSRTLPVKVLRKPSGMRRVTAWVMVLVIRARSRLRRAAKIRQASTVPALSISPVKWVALKNGISRRPPSFLNTYTWCTGVVPSGVACEVDPAGAGMSAIVAIAVVGAVESLSETLGGPGIGILISSVPAGGVYAISWRAL